MSKNIYTKFKLLKDSPDSVPNHLQMTHDTYSGLLWFNFFTDIQIKFDNDIHN